MFFIGNRSAPGVGLESWMRLSGKRFGFTLVEVWVGDDTAVVPPGGLDGGAEAGSLEKRLGDDTGIVPSGRLPVFEVSSGTC